MLDLPTPPASPGPSPASKPGDRLGQLLAGRIELTAVLGVGAYGTVYKARDIESNAQYAVKALDKVGLDQRQRSFQDREIQLHYQASRHENVVSLVQILDSPQCTFVVLEYCPEGDLFAKITEQGHYTGDDFKAKCIFLQILDAVRHCHSKGVYHRDLKPENILVKDNGWTVKLADFGLATQDRVSSDFGCGSTFYMSPECQQANPKPYACYASAPNDIWALGVILVNLTCGRNPWKRASMDDSTFRAYMRDRNFLRTILPISDQVNYILQRIFEVDPQRRITLAELRELIVCCTSLTRGSSAISAPPSPPRACDASMLDTSYAGVIEIPPMDPLPGQQYPTMPAVQYPSMTGYHAPLTPPHSNGGSPQLSPYTFTTSKPIPHASFAPPSSVAWSRRGQLISTINNLPRPACFWNNLQLH